VIVVCKPIGPGNWTPMLLEYAGPQLAPFTVAVGERFTLGTVTWRVCEVRP
jgi:hypothetical protein